MLNELFVQRMIKDYHKLSDHLLLEECRLNNLRAYDQLFERYFGKLYQFSLNYVKNSAVAEELVMDLMFNIWKKRMDLEVTGEFSAYLFTAMKNVMFNHLRKKELLTADISFLPEQAATVSHSADHRLQYKELEQVYQLKLSQLSPQRRKIFKLSREEQMTYPQIAESMNLSVNTIKTQMLVSLKYLRESLKEHIDITILLTVIFFF
ncbi:RNA polymerase sigma-70 factor [Pedobacter panaciterrae]|uniref:RNA polymerase sigma-70 factor n=1 Tax=Pedobacter panaciterrae TaxID=363849 RepID=UPI00155DBB4D|nr:RNA polymerase sigma-70 factor [Pedobacter panaciterrae]NQX53054.1 RNA polymerase sigma-70 factor [Pedobacter panaciterrae]